MRIYFVLPFASQMMKQMTDVCVRDVASRHLLPLGQSLHWKRDAGVHVAPHPVKHVMHPRIPACVLWSSVRSCCTRYSKTRTEGQTNEFDDRKEPQNTRIREKEWKLESRTSCRHRKSGSNERTNKWAKSRVKVCGEKSSLPTKKQPKLRRESIRVYTRFTG